MWKNLAVKIQIRDRLKACKSVLTSFFNIHLEVNCYFSLSCENGLIFPVIFITNMDCKYLYAYHSTKI